MWIPHAIPGFKEDIIRSRIKIIIAIILLMLVTSVAIGGFEKPVIDKAKSNPSTKTQDLTLSKVEGSKGDLFGQVQLFADAISILRSEYVEEVDSKKLVYGAMHGMLSSLDDYSSFMEPEEYEEIKVEAKGEFGGIGVEITLKDGILTIITPMAGTPAEEEIGRAHL